ncbi:MAG: Na+/H+ antiporter NhaC family protein [Gammaproteobacteria bacterium]|nr:Na+/H+ antiporter NhaC family protein [Gammaproteobacteria bacterium]MDH5652643.1 Na+/H+ antiporter NhaC family protein [Gammaproteobacteria bacterium]
MLRHSTAALIFFLLLLTGFFYQPIGPFDKVGAWYSLVPPLLAVVLAYTTHKLIPSLAIAILAGGLLVGLRTEPSIINGVSTGSWVAIKYVLSALTDPWSLKILGFVVLILMMIAIIILAGGLTAVADKLQSWAKSRRSTKLTTALLGLVVFIDDYANTMIVGSSMRPLSDKYKISREKLAFIIDATSAPVAGLAVISTWIGYETGLFGKTGAGLGIAKDGYAMFFDALPYRFYCILMLVFVFLNIQQRRDYGTMLVAERRACCEGKLLADDAVPMTSTAFSVEQPASGIQPRIGTAAIPFACLFIVLLGGLWIDGGGLQQMQSSLFAIFNPVNWLDVISKTKNNSTILLLASATGVLTATACALTIARANIQHILLAAKSGIRSSLLPMMILLLAWSLKAGCDDLNTGEFLVATIGQSISPLWYPAMVFLAASLTSFGTGTSWGTMAILIPTAIPVAFALDGNQYGLITMISLGAVLDGAIFGDHCSPISDTTIMSSIAGACDHLDHVKTQLPYALTVGVTALLIGYLPAALGLPVVLSYATAILLFYLALRLAGRQV